MFCVNCGNKIPDGSKFCLSCGAPVKKVSQEKAVSTRESYSGSEVKNQGPSKLVYESKGISPKRKMIITISSIALILIGIFIIFIRNHQNKGVRVINGFASGTIGGGYMFDDDGRRMLFILGVIIICAGLVALNTLIFGLSKNMFRVYTDHIEGRSAGAMFKKEFYLEYYQIQDIQMTHMGSKEVVLKIIANGDKYGVLLYNKGEIVYKYIRIASEKNRGHR